MTEQAPMTTADAAPAPQLTPAEVEQQRLNKQLYDYRKTCDPLLYERVIAFHQMANTSDEAFATFAADYDRAAAEHLPPPPPEA